MDTYSLGRKPADVYLSLLGAFELQHLAANLDSDLWKRFYRPDEELEVVGDESGPHLVLEQRRWREPGSPPVLPASDISHQRFSLYGDPARLLELECEEHADLDPTPPSQRVEFILGAEDAVLFQRALSLLDAVVASRPRRNGRETFVRWIERPVSL